MNQAKPQDVIEYIDHVVHLKGTELSYQLKGTRDKALYYNKHNIDWMSIQHVYDFEVYDFYDWCNEREKSKCI